MQAGRGLIPGLGTKSHMPQLRVCMLHLRPGTVKSINRHNNTYLKNSTEQLGKTGVDVIRCENIGKSREREWASHLALVVKNPLANAGDVRDTSSIPGLGRSPGGGHGNSLQYSCQENPTDRGAWWATQCPSGCKESDTTEVT